MFNFKPNKAQIADFKAKIEDMQSFIDDVFKNYNVIIEKNNNYSSFYFDFKNKNYRISTHRLPNRDALSVDKYRQFKNVSSFETIEIVKRGRADIKSAILKILKS